MEPAASGHPARGLDYVNEILMRGYRIPARVEKKLNTIDGVVATVNFATEAAIVTAPADVAVQQFIDAVEQLGYRAEILGRGAGGAPGDGPPEAGGRGGDADMVADLRKRLIVALVLFVPLTDLSVLLSLFPWSRFPGWQWVLIAVAAPVVVWSAWPFHAAALRNARHGSPRWTPWCRWASLRRAAGRCMRCLCWTAARAG